MFEDSQNTNNLFIIPFNCYQQILWVNCQIVLLSVNIFFFISTYICFYLFSIHSHFFIPPCQYKLMPISFYLFVNLNLRLYFSNPFSLSHSILCISTYICFYLFFIHSHFFIPPCQSKLTPISFYLFVNPNLRLYSSIPFSLSHSILCISTYIWFYLLSIHLYFFLPLSIHLYLFQSRFL